MRLGAIYLFFNLSFFFHVLWGGGGGGGGREGRRGLKAKETTPSRRASRTIRAIKKLENELYFSVSDTEYLKFRKN